MSSPPGVTGSGVDSSDHRDSSPRYHPPAIPVDQTPDTPSHMALAAAAADGPLAGDSQFYAPPATAAGATAPPAFLPSSSASPAQQSHPGRGSMGNSDGATTGTVRFADAVNHGKHSSKDIDGIQLGDEDDDNIGSIPSLGRGSEIDPNEPMQATLGTEAFTIYDLERSPKARLEIWQGHTIWEVMRNPAPFIRRHVPIISWFGGYQVQRDLGSDIIAGLGLWAALLSESMAYALLAGLSPEVGLYACFVPVLVYSVFGTIRHLSIGPVSLTGVMTGVALARIKEKFEEENALEGIDVFTEEQRAVFLSYAVVLTFLTGLIMFTLGLLNSGFLENVLSLPTRQGFITGVAIVVILHQLPGLIGAPSLKGEHTGIWHDLMYWPDMFQKARWQSTLFGLGSLIVLLSIKYYKSRTSNKVIKVFPGILLVLIVTVTVNSILKLDPSCVKPLGPIPRGPPPVRFPKFAMVDISTYFGTAAIIAFVGWVETVAVGREVSGHHQYPISANSEFVAMGLANLAGSFFSAMPVSGSIGRTLVVSDAGGRTQAAAVLASMLIFVSMFFTNALYYFPKPVTSAVIVYCVVSLIEYHDVAKMYKMKLYRDIGFYMSTLLFTLTVGLEQGLILGAAVSVVWVLRGSTTPHAMLLGRVPGTTVYQPITNLHRRDPPDNVIVVKPGTDVMFYANALSLKKVMHRVWQGRGPDGDLLKEWMVSGVTAGIVLDLSDISVIDITAVTTLDSIVTTSKMNGIQISFAGLTPKLRNQLVTGRLLRRLGRKHVHTTVHAAVEHLQQHFAQFDTLAFSKIDDDIIKAAETSSMLSSTNSGLSEHLLAETTLSGTLPANPEGTIAPIPLGMRLKMLAAYMHLPFAARENVELRTR